MENTELLIHLAEIAGVFVGFGALISIRNEATRDEEVMMIRQVVLFGILVVVVALTPVMISSFGVTGHGLWVTSTVVFLAFWWGSSMLNRWDTERTRALATVTRRARVRMETPAVPIWLSMNVALILILTGSFPDHEPALYVTAVTLNLFITAGSLLYLVYLQRRPRPAQAGDTPTDTADTRRENQPLA